MASTEKCNMLNLRVGKGLVINQLNIWMLTLVLKSIRYPNGYNDTAGLMASTLDLEGLK